MSGILSGPLRLLAPVGLFYESAIILWLLLNVYISTSTKTCWSAQVSEWDALRSYLEISNFVKPTSSVGNLAGKFLHYFSLEIVYITIYSVAQ